MKLLILLLNDAKTHHQSARIYTYNYIGLLSYRHIALGLWKYPVFSKSTKIILNYIFGLALFVWLCFSIYHQLKNQDNLHLSLLQVEQGLKDNWMSISLVLLLMLVNWGLEARKWQILVSPLENISFRKSFYAILSGVSLSVVTPNRIGEYGGRILYLHHDNRLSAITVTAIGSLSQIITTLLFGIVGLIYYTIHYGSVSTAEHGLSYLWVRIILFGAPALAILGLLLYFHLHLIISIFERIGWLKRFRTYVQVIRQFPAVILRKVLYFSVLRYLIFSAQYLILVNALGAEILWWQGLLMIYLIYVVMALIPTIAIAEVGIRGKIGLFFLGLLSVNKVAILAGTVGIWLINLLIPAILGSLLLPGIKVLNEGKAMTALPKKIKI